jgi:GT2 family glycosyltransferase
MHTLDIIIPTFNNYQYLSATLQSVLSNKTAANLFHIYVVNNGHENSCDWIDNDAVTVFNSGENLGWEGALKYALPKTSAPFVLFLNDDIHIPPTSKMWLNKMLQHFLAPEVGAVGPSSNVVMGLQNIFTPTLLNIFTTKYLIGFCFLTRREAILKAGGIDDTLPGGDDLDMSIRLRKAGYKLIADKEVFVYHHGFKTGTRVYGDEQRKNGWNSFEHLEKTNHALIKKHGFIEWWETIKGGYTLPSIEHTTASDTEGAFIRERIKGEVILDLGCAGNKTVPNAIGVDMIPKDEAVDTLNGQISQADVVADVSQPLPFEENSVDTIIARHILEHLMDSVTVLSHWRTLLREKGRLIIAVPNNAVHLTIPMNVEHVHGFSPQSLKTLLEVCGFKVVEQLDGGNTISFITIAEKI